MPDRPPRSLTILNVDDDEPGRYALSRLLRQAGYVVQEAATGAEGLRLLAEMPDVVLLDVHLPDISGLAVAQRIKANLLTTHIPIIHLSATATTPLDQINGLRGAEAYLVEPVVPEHLFALIDALVRYRDQARQAETRYRAVLAGAAIGVFTQDRDLRYTWMFSPSSGFDPLTVVGSLDVDLFPASEAAELERIKRGVLVTGQAAQAELTLTVPTGQRTFDLTVDPTLAPDGAREGVSSILLDVTDRKHAEEALRREAQLRDEVTRQREAQLLLEKSREADRTRLARELHDELGGALTVLKMDMAWLGKHLDGSPDSAEHLAGMHGTVDEIIRTVRRIAQDLRPALLDDYGLVAALKGHFDEFIRRSGLGGSFHGDVEHLPLPPESAMGCFRIFQEALTNVARHAAASQVDVQVEVDAGWAIVRVTDNGRGMDLAAAYAKRHLGLVGMRERALLMAGTLDIRSAAGQGTTVLLKVPLQTPDEPA